MPDDVLTIKEVAPLLKLAEKTVYAMAQAGETPSFEIRGQEQRAVVEHIARATAKLDAVRAATERTIALLKERRSALIAAAVTGQLDLTREKGAAA